MCRTGALGLEQAPWVLCPTMSVEYGDITSEEAIAFCLPDAAKARDDTLTLLQVSEKTHPHPVLLVQQHTRTVLVLESSCCCCCSF